MRIITTWLLLMTMSSCGSPTPDAGAQSQPPASNAAESTRNMPPGFMDEAPPPPTSDTLVLSGGTLITDTELHDSVVVLHKGKLVTWGKRGATDMPNDSIGFITAGKFVVPGSMEDLEAGALPNLSRFITDQPANLLVFDVYDPASLPGAQLAARVEDGRLIELTRE